MRYSSTRTGETANGSAQRSVGSALRLRATLPIVGDRCHWGASSRLTLIVRAELVATVLSSACASHAARPAAPHSLPPSAARVVTVPTAVSVPTFAPIETGLRLSDDYTARGGAALDRGQFDEARRRFAAALALLLEVRTTLPGTVASRRFDDAIDRVRTLEQSAYSATRTLECRRFAGGGDVRAATRRRSVERCGAGFACVARRVDPTEREGAIGHLGSQGSPR